MKILKYLLIISLAAIWSCSDVEPTIAPSPDQTEESGDGNESEEPTEQPPDGMERVRIDLGTTFQTIESFSASDCWMGDRVGKWSTREELARYLFSDEIVDGQPQGIALSGWRFNLGAGTAQQGDASGLTGDDIRARTESFMDPVTGELDWNRASGQRFFLEKAVQYGNTAELVLFSNSPPVYMTANGLGYKTTADFHANIEQDRYGEFGDYLADVVNHFRDDEGIVFNYVSPVNEPQYDWTGGQEGSPYYNGEISGLVKEIDASFARKGVTGTKIMVPEAGEYYYLYQNASDPAGNQIEEFFNSSSANYIGGLPYVADLAAGHSYWTDKTWSNIVDTRSRVATAVASAGLKFYQTEWSMLGDEPAGFGSYDDATGIRFAVYMSRIINADLRYANASSWSYWTVFDLPRWNHQDRFSLIKVWPGGNLYPTTEEGFAEEGPYEVNKNLWVLGNYSLFVRPGYKRIALDMDDESEEFFGTAFVSSDQSKIVCVYTNISRTESYDVRADFGDTPALSIKIYTTDDDNDLKESTASDKYTPIEVGPESVVTVVYNIGS